MFCFHCKIIPSSGEGGTLKYMFLSHLLAKLNSSTPMGDILFLQNLLAQKTTQLYTMPVLFCKVLYFPPTLLTSTMVSFQKHHSFLKNTVMKVQEIRSSLLIISRGSTETILQKPRVLKNIIVVKFHWSHSLVF